MSLTKEEIKEKLKSIQNHLNQYDFDDESVNKYVDLIFADIDSGKERSEDEKETFLSHIIDQHYREIVKDLSHITITKDKYDMHYICLKSRNKLYPILQVFTFRSHREEIIQDIHKWAEECNTIYANGYTTCEIEFPSGEILFANYFKNAEGKDYAFEVPEDLKYKERNSINHSFGEQNTMKILSKEHGLGYVQLGNTSATVYKVNDDRIVITSAWASYYDEETEQEEDISIPEEWQELGEICCDVWRVEFIDVINFSKKPTLPLDHEGYEYNRPFTGKVNPGIWTVKNRYHFMDDQKEMKKGNIPIWVEMNRKEL
jgi:hypothetical protein